MGLLFTIRNGIAIRDSPTSTGRWPRSDQDTKPFRFPWNTIGRGPVKAGFTVGLHPTHRPVVSQMDRPQALVHQVMVSRAQWHEIVEIGCSASFPRNDVMDLAVLERDSAMRMSAGAVHGSESTSLCTGGGAMGAPYVEHLGSVS